MIEKIRQFFLDYLNKRQKTNYSAALRADYMRSIGLRTTVNNGFGEYPAREKNAKPLWNKNISKKARD